MLDPALKEQLRTYLTNVRQPIELVSSLDDSTKSTELAELLDEIADLQRRVRSFRPLLVLDRPVFREARRHGFVLELVLPEDGWTGADPWSDYLAARLTALIDLYQLWHLSVVHGSHLDPLTVALLTRLADRLPADLRVGPGQKG